MISKQWCYLLVFAGVAVVWTYPGPWRHREQHFYAVLEPENQGSQLTSAREIQTGTAVIGAALPSTVDALHTVHMC